MRVTLSVLLAFFVFSGAAQPNPPTNLHLQDLRIWLKTNWYDAYFTDLGYNQARIEMYSYTDEVNGAIACIYTGFEQPAEAVTFPDPINAEHIVPQSFFGSVSPMRSDLYNLRPSHGSANSARSNYPYGECPDNQSNWYGIDGNGNYFSTGTTPNPNVNFSELANSFWEPREDRKGDLARQIFYFYTMYPTQAGDIALMGDINTLYQWHIQDPVDSYELTRSNRVSEVQGNENPYVLYADLVYEAWFWVAIPGCTDPAALNYDAGATEDDGSCVYGPISGCTYSNATNYNSNATIDDGSCLFDSGTPGCTYPAAQNYNPAATVDDGSCTYDPGVFGCTYPDALNYNASATVDDGTCLYDNGTPGCTYVNATNYASSATVDDGSCVFELANNCPSDINGDGVVDVEDFLLFLGSFGAPCP